MARVGGLLIAAVATLAACSGSSGSPTPTPIPLGVSCLSAEQVQTTLASAFGSDTLTLGVSQGTGQSADTLYCSYRAENGDDVSIQTTVGSRAASLFQNTLDVGPSNPSVEVAPIQVATNAWAATAPARQGPGREIVAAGALEPERYVMVFYRYLAYPVPAPPIRPAPTTDETVALLTLALE
jgi:hypothetical protein